MLNLHTRFLFIALLLGLSILVTAHAQHPDDIHWDTRFGLPGVDGEIRCMAVDGDWIYVGGLFEHAGDQPARNIARWNRRTHRWSALGDGASNGVDGMVMAIAVKGDDLYIGGQFKEAGGIASENLTRWNSTSGEWRAFDNGATGDRYAYIAAIAIDGENIYVGGRFSAMGTLLANNVAWFDGKEWQRLDVGVSGYVFSLLARSGELYVGGAFRTAGIDSVQHVARWDGSRWDSLGAGLGGDVFTMVFHKGEVYAGGEFTRSGDRRVWGVARWDDGEAQWQPLDTVTTIGSGVFALASHGDSLFAGGDMMATGFSVAGLHPYATIIAVWNGRSWGMLQAEEDSTLARNVVDPGGVRVHALASVGSEIFIAGNFTAAAYQQNESAQQAAMNITSWSIPSQSWRVIGNTPSAPVQALAVDGGSIYLGGAFMSAGAIDARKVVRLDDAGWHPLGSGIDGGRFYNYEGINMFGIGVGETRDGGAVRTLIVHDGILYAGGDFNRAGDLQLTSNVRLDSTHSFAMPRRIDVAAWDGAGWTPLVDTNAPTPQRPAQAVLALARFNDRLVAGRLDTLSFVDGGLFYREGSAWLAVDSSVGTTVYAIASAEDELYVGTSQGVFVWNGSAWSSPGSGVNGRVLAIAVDGDRVYIGGDFTKAGDLDANCIALWNRTTRTWSTLGTGVDRDDPLQPPYVSAIAVSSHGLYIGGWFDVAGDESATNVARWDGETWSGLGSGVDDAVHAIAIHGNDVYLGGEFHRAGSSPSWYVARWNATAIAAAPERAAVTGGGSALLQALPNPSTDRTTIRFSVARGTSVRLSIHDLLGHEVALLIDGPVDWGESSLSFDAGRLPAGTYMLRLTAGGTIVTRTMIVAR